MQQILIIGTGGLAREFTEWCKDSFAVAGYYSDRPAEHAQYNMPGKFFGDEVSPATVGTDLAFIAIGSPAIKQKLYEQFINLGFKFPIFIHPSSVVASSAVLHEGVIVAPNCVVAPNVVLQKLTYVNFGCGIGHETTLGSFCQINPGAQIGGGVTIADNVLVGSGATILQNINVGANSIVGSGSTVFAAVAAGITVLGNPAKRLHAFAGA